MAETILSAARGMPSQEDVETLVLNEPNEVELWRLQQNLAPEDGGTRPWDELIGAGGEFTEWLTAFTLDFMLMTEVSLKSAPWMLKFRYVETQEPANMLLRERLNLVSYGTLLAAPGVGAASREHLRVEGPAGMLIEDVDLFDMRDDPDVRQAPVAAQGKRTFERRVSLDRAVIYTSKPPRGSYYAAVSMRVNPAGFIRRSQYLIFLTAIVLVAGGLAEERWRTLSASSNATEPTVALLLVIPTLLLAYISREGDHQILGDLLRVPRLVVAFTGVVSLAAAAGFVFGLKCTPLAWLWIVAGVWSCVVFVWLRWVTYRGHAVVHSVTQRHDKTYTIDILEFS
ncbi:hypothetical protein [Pedococcus aerophilus]|uniref:hypothetical protein n=1 Tax=Pedococcus aerophilus TaxID=436356 RepID=UPI0031E40075